MSSVVLPSMQLGRAGGRRPYPRCAPPFVHAREVAEFRRQTLAPDELTRPCSASGSLSHPSRSGRLGSTPRLVNGSAASDAFADVVRVRSGATRRELRQALGCHLGSSEPLRPELHVVRSHPEHSKANVTASILQLPASTELDLRQTARASLRVLCSS